MDSQIKESLLDVPLPLLLAWTRFNLQAARDPAAFKRAALEPTAERSPRCNSFLDLASSPPQYHASKWILQGRTHLGPVDLYFSHQGAIQKASALPGRTSPGH